LSSAEDAQEPTKYWEIHLNNGSSLNYKYSRDHALEVEDATGSLVISLDDQIVAVFANRYWLSFKLV
jgi:hypothetical protein